MKYLIRLITLFFVLVLSVMCEKENQPPVIQNTGASSQIIKTEETTQLTCLATDPDGDQLTYSWSSSNGTFLNGTSGSSVVWKASDKPGDNLMSVIVNDGQDVADGSINITVEANPQLSVSPLELNFGVEDRAKEIEIRNTGSGTLTWEVIEDLDWIIGPINGSTSLKESLQVPVQVERDGLSPGTHEGTITINSNGGSQVVSVRITHEDNPRLSRRPVILNFGPEDTEKIIEIRNVDFGTLSWTITEDMDWLTLSAVSGNTTEADTVLVTVERIGLSTGNHEGNITINSNGGSLGVNVTIQKFDYVYITDPRDGISYKTIKIGDQWWMAENLAYDAGEGCYPANNHENYVKTYGRTYTWEAAKKACPSGWHLPTDEEWKQLEIAIGMSQSEAEKYGPRGTNEGTKLKSKSRWENNDNGTDDYGFNGLPAGTLFKMGTESFWGGNGWSATWWSATEDTSSFILNRNLIYWAPFIERNTRKKEDGLSVRCVKD